MLNIKVKIFYLILTTFIIVSHNIPACGYSGKVDPNEFYAHYYDEEDIKKKDKGFGIGGISGIIGTLVVLYILHLESQNDYYRKNRK